MLIVDKGNFLIIPVYHKQYKKIVQIKNTRFNPEFHEMLEDSFGSPGRIQHMHEEKPVIIKSESPVIEAALNEVDESLKEAEVSVVADAPPEVSVEVAPLKKKRGMPKGGWPKKAKKKKGE